jgi:cellulase/cellobiase CelA1
MSETASQAFYPALEHSTPVPEPAPVAENDDAVRTEDGVGGTATTVKGAEHLDEERDPEQGILSDQDVLLVTALGQGHTHASAAKLLGVSTKTVQRRLANRNFAAAVERERHLRFEQIERALSRAAVGAAQALVDATQSERDSDRIRAAEAILNQYGRFHRQAVDENRATILDQGRAGLGRDQQNADPSAS